MSFLGIDIGTSSICGVVYHPTSKNIVSITKANNASLTSVHPWEKTQDAAVIIDSVRTLVGELQSQAPDIKGIGLSGQMHGIVYVNGEGEAVSPLYTWQDARGNLPYRDNLSYTAYLATQTGQPLATGFGLVTHFYNQVNGLIPPGAVRLCTIMDYAAMQLTGRKQPFLDYSNAASLGFFDKERLRFDDRALGRAGIDASFLPEIGDATVPVGWYENIPVFPAIGDNQASFLGSVRSIRESIHVTVGTSSQLSVYSDTYLDVPSLDTRPLPGGGYILVGAALCGGCSFALLKNFFAETIKLGTGKEMDDAALYNILTSIPYQADAEEDLQVETLFDGTRLHPEKRGKITHISRSNWTPQNLVLGFLKGMSRELYDFYRLLPASVRKGKNKLVGSGNGLQKNPLLARILEETFNCPLQISSSREEAALGACICSMVGTGYLADFAAFEKGKQLAGKS